MKDNKLISKNYLFCPPKKNYVFLGGRHIFFKIKLSCVFLAPRKNLVCTPATLGSPILHINAISCTNLQHFAIFHANQPYFILCPLPQPSSWRGTTATSAINPRQAALKTGEGQPKNCRNGKLPAAPQFKEIP